MCWGLGGKEDDVSDLKDKANNVPNRRYEEGNTTGPCDKEDNVPVLGKKEDGALGPGDKEDDVLEP